MKPRDYQLDAIVKCREAFLNGHKHIALCLSVGAGKSLVAKLMLEMAKDKKIGFFSFRTILIEQMKQHFADLDITYGTLQAHGKVPTELFDLAIIDESWGHGSKLKDNIKSKYSITLSGTPIDESGYALKFDYIVDLVQLPDLVKMGYAKPIRVLSTSKVDTSVIKSSGKDFNKQQSFDVMDKPEIKKDIVDTYNLYAKDKKTLLFAIDTKHAESLKDEFIANGIVAETIHSKKKNDGTLKAFESGEIELLINVEMITVGVDIPSINCIMMCRPMKSIPLFIQCVGRATRIDYNNPDDEALVIDCCEVLKRTNHHPMQRLDMNRVKTKKKAKVCQTCQEDMKIISRKAYAKDELTYINKTTYRCSNAHTLVEENMAVYNLNFCESCGVQLQAGNIEMKITTKAIEFYVKCKCGAEKVERKILLTDKELKEVQYEETMNGSDNWDKVELVLKDIAKELKYNWKWVTHKIVAFKALEREPSEILAKIEELKAKGHKLSAIAYI